MRTPPSGLFGLLAASDVAWGCLAAVHTLPRLR